MQELFIGPFGQAKLNAINFVADMCKASVIINVLDQIESLESVLENEDITDVEKKLTTKLIDELLQCLLDIDGESGDEERNREISKVFN